MRLLLLLILWSLAIPIIAQIDSTILFAERLKAKDIRTNITNITAQKITSVGEVFQSLADLPFTVYVITKEDIRNNGYNTLVDALKMVPGIRVSQPGSGPDGETFLMRGLKGNTYATIMINNVPLKPIGARALPIGAQLPIKQAERIEVIYGPVGTVYGADAAAGVINIVLKESERPLYTKADIGFGAEGYSSMNMLFGGKLGKTKKTLKYNVFGSYTSFDNQRIFPEHGAIGGAYNPKMYDVDSVYQAHPNYVEVLSNDRQAAIAAPHLSRMFGVELNYGHFELSLISMYRRDHSSLGLNPSAYSYINPFNFIGETVRQVHLGYGRKKENRTFNISLNVIGLESDGKSSFTMLNNELNQAMATVAAADDLNGSPLADRIDDYYNTFMSRNRYFYDNKIDIYLESIWNFKVFKKWNGTIGLTPRGLVSISEYFLETPYPNQFNDHTISSNNSETSTFVIDAFTQLFYNGKKLKGLLGVQANYANGASDAAPAIFPRMAFLYKINPKLSFRAFAGTAYRNSQTYYSKNSYTVVTGNYNWLILGYHPLLPEITTSQEAGFRWAAGRTDLYADVAFFATNTKQLINHNVVVERDEITNKIDNITVGYFNEPNSFSRTYGLQTALSWKNTTSKMKFSANLNFTYSIGNAFLNNREEDFVREQPRAITQLKFSFNLWKNIFLYFDNLYVSEIKNKQIYAGSLSEYNTLPSYYTLDMSVIGRLTEHFQMNFKLKNVFSASYAGLAVTGSTDDLFWNQQSFRTWELGFSYRME